MCCFGGTYRQSWNIRGSSLMVMSPTVQQARQLPLPRILSWILLHCTGKHEAAMAKKRLRKQEKQRHDCHKLHLQNGHLLFFSTNFEPHCRSSSVFMF